MTEKVIKTGTVLDKIADATRERSERAKAKTPPAAMRARALGARKPLDFAAAVRRPPWGVIAEVKLASPSEGDIGRGLDPAAVAKDYEAHGAAAISVLTEPDFFKGSIGILENIRTEVAAPLLMKDFMLEEYQLWQARASGADAVLFIMALIGEEGLRSLMPKALELGLSPLVEVHDESELQSALRQGARLVGVNNRDLKSLKVDLNVSRRLAPLARMPGITLVCESGISRRAELDELAALGFNAFLIGTHFIKTGRPGRALAELLSGGKR